MNAINAANEAREEMDAAIRNYADALWRMQDELSEDGDRNECVLGDILVVAHFTPTNLMIRDNMGDIVPSPQYILLNPRSLPPHAMSGLLDQADLLVAQDMEISLSMMYPEDDDV